MQRRDLLLIGTSAVAASVTSALVACADKQKAGATTPVAARGTRQDALVAAAGKCITAGEICLAHCIASLAAGETMLAECARAVHDMLAVCRMIATLGSSGSAHLAAAAALCDAVCRDCKAACDKHGTMHPECKACGEACGEMLAQVAQLK